MPTMTRPQIAYPRPLIAVLPTELFREPVYEGGESYAVGDDLEDEG